jgi:hypothetical protein
MRSATIRTGSLIAGLALFGASAIAASVAVPASPADIDLSARVEPSSILVGDPVRYILTVTRPADVGIELPAVRGNTGRLDVEGYKAARDTLPDGRVRETHTLALTAWIPGEDTLPPQRVEVRRADDTAVTALYTPATVVTVRASAPKDAKDIADIRDARRLPRPFPWGLPVLLAALGAAWLIHRALKRRPKPVPAAAPAPVITPEEAALARLSELEGATLSAREFAFALSEIARAHLAGRFGIDALEATSEELLERVKPLSLRAGREAWLRAWCESLDLAKFADAALSPADRTRLVDEARAFVVEYTPAAPAETSSVDSGPTPDTGRPA